MTFNDGAQLLRQAAAALGRQLRLQLLLLLLRVRRVLQPAGREDVGRAGVDGWGWGAGAGDGSGGRTRRVGRGRGSGGGRA